MKINIFGLPRAKVLMELYNIAVGGPHKITFAEAERLLKENSNYIKMINEVTIEIDFTPANHTIDISQYKKKVAGSFFI